MAERGEDGANGADGQEEPENAEETEDTARSEPGDTGAEPRDFSQAIADLTREAQTKHDESQAHMSRGMRAAMVAVAALLLIVVGVENIVRRGLDSLVPTPMQKAALAAEEKAAAARVLGDKSSATRGIERSMRELQVRADTRKSLEIALREAQAAERNLSETASAHKDRLAFEVTGLAQADKQLADGRKSLEQLETTTARLKKDLAASTDGATQAELRAEEAAKDLVLAEGRLIDFEKQLAQTRSVLEQANDTTQQYLDLSQKSFSALEAAEQRIAQTRREGQKLLSELNRLKAEHEGEGPIGKARIAAEIAKMPLRMEEVTSFVKKYEQELSYRQREAEARKRLGEEENLRLRKLAKEASQLEGRIAAARSDIDRRRSEVAQRRSDAARSATARAKDKGAFDAASESLRKMAEQVQTLQKTRTDRSALVLRARRDLESTEAEIVRATERIATQMAALASTAPIDLNRLAIMERELTAAQKELALAQADQKQADDEARQAAEKARASADEGSLQALITRGGAVFGAVGILILLIQVFVSTTRYHARLADLYKAQAIALTASGGDVETAKALLERLLPLQVDFGKTPTSLYEKALDTVSQVAKAR